jgi:hypothetical protein
MYLGLQVAMHDAPVQVDERGDDVGEDHPRAVRIDCGPVHLDVLTQVHVPARHHDHPAVQDLAAVEDRHDVARRADVDEQQLPVGPGGFRYELCDHMRVPRGCGPYDTEAAAADLLGDLPLFGQRDFHVRGTMEGPPVSTQELAEVLDQGCGVLSVG